MTAKSDDEPYWLGKSLTGNGSFFQVTARPCLPRPPFHPPRPASPTSASL
jgi:hypothetical protein